MISVWRNLLKHIENILAILWLCWNCYSTVEVLFLLTFSLPVNDLQCFFKAGCHMIQVEPFWVINVCWVPENKSVFSSTNLIKLNKTGSEVFFQELISKLISLKLEPCIIYIWNKTRLFLWLMIVCTCEMRKWCLVVTQKIPLCLWSDLTSAISWNKFVVNKLCLNQMAVWWNWILNDFLWLFNGQHKTAFV